MSPLRKAPALPLPLLLLLLPPQPLRLPPLLLHLLPLLPVPPVPSPSPLLCPAISWMSRSRPVTAVKAGDTLLILEAMKMENEISAPQDGTIASVNVRKGDVVNSGDLLITMN